MWCRRPVSVTHTAFADKVTATLRRVLRGRVSLQHNQTIIADPDRLRTATARGGYAFQALAIPALMSFAVNGIQTIGDGRLM
jgi:hypothetical protein